MSKPLDPESIFRNERLQFYKSQATLPTSLKVTIKEEWSALTQEEREKYHQISENQQDTYLQQSNHKINADFEEEHPKTEDISDSYSECLRTLQKEAGEYSSSEFKMPRVPLNPFLLYQTEQYPFTRYHNPQLSPVDLQKKIKHDWDNISPEQNKHYQDLSDQFKTKFESIRTIFHQISEKPKKPMNSFALFFKEKHTELKQQQPTSNLQEITKAASEIWKKLETKTEYQLQAEKIKQEYQQKTFAQSQCDKSDLKAKFNVEKQKYEQDIRDLLGSLKKTHRNLKSTTPNPQQSEPQTVVNPTTSQKEAQEPEVKAQIAETKVQEAKPITQTKQKKVDQQKKIIKNNKSKISKPKTQKQRPKQPSTGKQAPSSTRKKPSKQQNNSSNKDPQLEKKSAEDKGSEQIQQTSVKSINQQVLKVKSISKKQVKPAPKKSPEVVKKAEKSTPKPVQASSKPTHSSRSRDKSADKKKQSKKDSSKKQIFKQDQSKSQAKSVKKEAPQVISQSDVKGDQQAKADKQKSEAKSTNKRSKSAPKVIQSVENKVSTGKNQVSSKSIKKISEKSTSKTASKSQPKTTSKSAVAKKNINQNNPKTSKTASKPKKRTQNKTNSKAKTSALKTKKPASKPKKLVQNAKTPQGVPKIIKKIKKQSHPKKNKGSN